MKYERRYARYKKVAHLFTAGMAVGTHGRAICGYSPLFWDWGWYGSGSQTEYETAESLPICKKCEQRTERGKR